MKMSLAASIAALVLATASAAQADIITSDTLGHLIATNGTITSGDKLFSNFTYGITNDMPLADDVNVTAITDPLGNVGIRFQGAFRDLPSSTGASDALITFTVTVTDPKLAISDAHLVSNMAFFGPDTDGSITESFRYNTPPIVGQLLATPTNQEVSLAFDVPYSMLRVQKDIALDAGTTAGNTAVLSMIDQTFTQVEGPGVPEPASLGLLAAGGLALLSRRR